MNPQDFRHSMQINPIVYTVAKLQKLQMMSLVFSARLVKLFNFVKMEPKKPSLFDTPLLPNTVSIFNSGEATSILTMPREVVRYLHNPYQITFKSGLVLYMLAAWQIALPNNLRRIVRLNFERKSGLYIPNNLREFIVACFRQNFYITYPEGELSHIVNYMDENRFYLAKRGVIFQRLILKDQLVLAKEITYTFGVHLVILLASIRQAKCIGVEHYGAGLLADQLNVGYFYFDMCETSFRIALILLGDNFTWTLPRGHEQFVFVPNSGSPVDLDAPFPSQDELDCVEKMYGKIPTFALLGANQYLYELFQTLRESPEQIMSTTNMGTMKKCKRSMFYKLPIHTNMTKLGFKFIWNMRAPLRDIVMTPIDITNIIWDNVFPDAIQQKKDFDYRRVAFRGKLSSHINK